jgi:hypothetical protein
MTFSVALQAFTIREEIERDYFGSLARVAEIGYRNLQTMGVV